jgi:hypothetical protein
MNRPVCVLKSLPNNIILEIISFGFWALIAGKGV